MQKYAKQWAQRYSKRIADEEKRLQTAKKVDFLTLKDQKWQDRGNAVSEILEHRFVSTAQLGYVVRALYEAKENT